MKVENFIERDSQEKNLFFGRYKKEGRPIRF
jgi:hypothetical protein